MLLEDDTKAIQTLHDEWIRREMAGETRTLVDLCTDEVVLMPPGQPPVMGRTAVAEALGQPGPEVLTVTADIQVLRGDTTTAFKLASFQSSFRNRATGETRTVLGSHVWVLERDSRGTWRVALLTWTLNGTVNEPPN